MNNKVDDAYKALTAHNAAIGELLGARPAERWSIMDAPEQAIVTWFDGFNAEGLASAWMQGQLPEQIAAHGWHPVRQLVWDDYLGLKGESPAACRFINWAFRQPIMADASSLLEVHRLAVAGASVSQALASLFLGGDVLAQLELCGWPGCAKPRINGIENSHDCP